MNGVSAINMAETLHPDIIIMDINIPLINGIQALKTIRENDTRVHFIVVTGYDDFQYCREALRVSTDDYILKPVDYENFGEVIQKTVYRIEKDADLSQSENNTSKDAGSMSEIMDWIMSHYAEDVSLQRIAELFNMNSSYISQMFKEKLGINYYAFLKQLRIEKANQLLHNTNLSVSQIAERVGYGDYRSFSRVYHEIMGHSPSDERSGNSID